MFKEMVPEYVIRRMLNQETIADECAKVTVLFVLIDSFNEYTRSLVSVGMQHTTCFFLLLQHAWAAAQADGRSIAVAAIPQRVLREDGVFDATTRKWL